MYQDKCGTKVDIELAKFVTYSCLSAVSLSEFIKVNKELFDTNTVLDNGCLDPFKSIALHKKGFRDTLVRAGMTVSTCAHVLN